MKLIRSLLLLVLVALVALTSVGNAPAPWWACDGKLEGEPCEPYGADTGGGCGVSGDDGRGVCRLQAQCTDAPETSVNECLYCD